MPTPKLLAALKTERFYAYQVFDLLIARGARTQTVKVLDMMLRDKNDRSGSLMARKMLTKAGAPVAFDWDVNLREQPPEDRFSLMGWEIEMRGEALVTSGKIYLGREVADGFDRQPKDGPRVPADAQVEFTVTGPGLAQPVVKAIEIPRQAGEQSWDGVTLASGLAFGAYTVSIYTHAQTVLQDGTPFSLNHNPPSLSVEAVR
jgi:hypothetical protein